MLVVESVRKTFGGTVAVRDLSFTIPGGSTFGLLGPNGAGKTTTMRIILGIVLADGGTLTWNGARIDERVRTRFGYLPEERGLYGRMRVRDQVVYFARLHGVGKTDAERRTDEWIEQLDLRSYANDACSELSKGNQQKVQVACAAVHHPDLLILDEPFSGLDPVNATMLLTLLEELRRKGATLVLSSHEMWQLERLCTDFCIIAHGQARARGTLAELRADWPSKRIRIAPSSEAVRGVIAAIPEARAMPSGDGAVTYEFPLATDAAALLRALVGVEAITEFQPIEPSLQELYLRAVGAA